MIPVLIAIPMLLAFILVLVDILVKSRRIKAKVVPALYLLGSFLPWLVLLTLYKDMPVDEIVGGWSRVGGIEVALNSYNFYFILGALIMFSVVSLYSAGHFRTGKEYSVILLMEAGVLGAFISRDLFNYYIYMEIASVSAFILTALSDEKGAKKAAFRYLVFSLTASYLFIFAIGIIYLKTGYLNLELIKGLVTPSKEINVAIGIAFSALLLKAGIFPLHFWLPDAHSKASTPASALLSGVVVKVPIYGMLLLFYTLPVGGIMRKALLTVAFLSIFGGLIGALLQMNAKRLLAYSTVSQLGYLLFGLSTGNVYGTIYYTFAHMLFKGGLFLGIGSLADAQGTKDLRELSYRENKGVMIAVLLLSLALSGISPFITAYGKKLIMEGLTGLNIFLLYAATTGTMLYAIKLNYFLLESGKNGSVKAPVSLILALLTLLSGIYLNPSINLTEWGLLVLASSLFIFLKKAGTLEKSPHFKPIHELGREVNMHMIILFIFVLMMVLIQRFQ
ncbi:proton-conducting transporter transmembrane domain-containing protein [Thermococcus sp.]